MPAPVKNFVQLNEFQMDDLVVGSYTVDASYELLSSGQWQWRASVVGGNAAASLLLGAVSLSGKTTSAANALTLANQAVDGLYDLAMVAEGILNP